MTYLKDGEEYLTSIEMDVWNAVGKLTADGRTVNNSQVAIETRMSRTSTALVAQTLRGRGYLKDTAPAKSAYHWRQTGKQPANVKDVHTEHCCKVHGCKYGLEHCPVKLGQKVQSFPCESCGEPMTWEMTDKVWQTVLTALDEAIAWRDGHGNHPSRYGKVYAGPSEKFDDLIPFEQALNALHDVRRASGREV